MSLKSEKTYFLKKTLTQTSMHCCWKSLIFKWLIVLYGLSGVLNHWAEAVTQGAVYFYVGCFTERADLFKDPVYARIPQTCIEICEVKSYEYAILFGEKCFCSKEINQRDRQDDRLCNIRCDADKSQHCGGVGVHSYYSTAWDKRLSVYNARVVNTTENSLIVQWQSANEYRMHMKGEESAMKLQINNFLIKTKVVETFSSFPVFPQPEFIVQKAQRYFELTDLHPGTQFNITIEALCEEKACGSASVLGKTLIGTPSPKPKNPKIIERSEKTITIEIDPITNDNGPVSKILVIVERADEVLSQEFDPNLLGSWDKAKENGVPFYIAAEIEYNPITDKRPIQFVVGDGKQYGGYQNVPLDEPVDDEKPADIHISLGVVSSWEGVTKVLYSQSGHEQHANVFDDFVYSTFDKGPQSIIALAVTCSVFGIFVVLCAIIYFYLRCSRFKQTTSLTYNQEMNEIHDDQE